MKCLFLLGGTRNCLFSFYLRRFYDFLSGQFENLTIFMPRKKITAISHTQRSFEIEVFLEYHHLYDFYVKEIMEKLDIKEEVFSKSIKDKEYINQTLTLFLVFDILLHV